MTDLTWEQLRQRTLQRMAEYTAGGAEHPLRSSVNAQTIYDRMTDTVRDMVAIIQERSSEKLEETEPMTYTANTASVLLPVLVRRRPVLGVEWLISGTDSQPLFEATRAQFDNYLRDFGSSPGIQIQPLSGDLYYFLDGQNKLALIPKPSQQLSLNIRYVPGVPAITAPTFNADGTVNVINDGSGTPTLLPEEHHASIATITAASFLRETGNNRLDDEVALKMISLKRWADRSPSSGPRYVHEE